MATAIWCYMPTERKQARKPDESEATKQVRLFVDLAEKITDLQRVTEESSAQICDRILRPEIEELWQQHRPQIEKMRALLVQEEQIREEVRNKVKAKRRV